MYTETNFLLPVILLNIAIQLAIFSINITKNNFDNPILFKIITYPPTILITITIFSIYTYIGFGIENVNPLIYFFIGMTTLLSLIHFVLDEDLLFRFDKFVNFMVVAGLSITIWVIAFYFVLT